MKYVEAIQTVDTEKALEVLGLETKRDGSYFHFTSLCGHDVVIRTHGEKKNLIYCPTCKTGSNIFKLAKELKGIEYETLIDKASKPQKPIKEELNLNYQLEWCKEMETLELNQIICQGYEIGKAKGKTMLSGCIVFTVLNENGLKVAYWGIKISDNSPKFHSSFNPESYIYNYSNIDPNKEVWITDDMFNCLRLIASGKQAVSNFELHYLSVKQYSLLSNFNQVIFDWKGEKRDVAYSNITQLKTFYRFA